MINKTREFFVSITSSKPSIKSVDSILATFKETVKELEEAAAQQDQDIANKNAEIEILQSEVDAASLESDRAKKAAQKISDFWS
jgi:predicted RNase H-like nuclease (RuvC/YqgF family)